MTGLFKETPIEESHKLLNAIIFYGVEIIEDIILGALDIHRTTILALEGSEEVKKFVSEKLFDCLKKEGISGLLYPDTFSCNNKGKKKEKGSINQFMF